MGFVIVLVVIYFAVWLGFPYLKRWVARRAERMMMNRMEHMMRSAAGMPPRDKKQQHRRRQSREAAEVWTVPPRRKQRRRPDEPVIPKEYAVDVEYTEYKEFRNTTFADGSKVSYQEEEQVTDVEWTEVKDKK